MGKKKVYRLAGSISVIALLMVVTTVFVPAGTTLAANVATVSVQPETTTVDPGDEFEVEIIVDTGSVDSSGAQCLLSWEPAGILECTGVAMGSKYDDFTPLYIGPEGEDAYNNSAGSFADQIGISCNYVPGYWQDPGGPTGSGTLLIVSFKAIEEGIAKLTLSDAIVGQMYQTTEPEEEITSIETVNGKVFIGEVEDALPDLVVSSLVAEWVEQDESYDISFEVQNEGMVDSEACMISVYIDEEEVVLLDCPALESDETFDDTVGTFTLGDESDTIKVFVDSAEVIEEEDEENNTLEETWEIGSMNLPDLVVENLSADWTVKNETYSVYFEIVNQGTLLAAAGKVDIIIDGQVVKTAECPELDPGEVREVTTGPFDISDETDEVEIRADSEETIEEGDESNNTATLTIEKGEEGQPDLMVEEFSLDKVNDDDTYEVNFQVLNQGTAASSACTVVVTIDSQQAATLECPTIEAGEVYRLSAGPFEIDGESDSVKVCVDTDFTVTETNELNNCEEGSLETTSIVLPDLVIRNLDQNWITIGETYEVSFELVNEGETYSDDSLIRISIDGETMATVECPGLSVQEYYYRQAGPFELSGDSDVIEISIESGQDESNISNNSVQGTLRDMNALTTAPTRSQGVTIAWEYLGATIFAVIVAGTVIVLIRR